MTNRIHPRLLDECASKALDVLISSANREADRDYNMYLTKMDSLLRTIQKSPAFSDNFSFQDLDDFLEIIGARFTYPIGNSKSNVRPAIRRYLSQKVTSFDFYISIGEAFYFEDGYELGRTRIWSFTKLPSI